MNYLYYCQVKKEKFSINVDADWRTLSIFQDEKNDCFDHHHRKQSTIYFLSSQTSSLHHQTNYFHLSKKWKPRKLSKNQSKKYD